MVGKEISVPPEGTIPPAEIAAACGIVIDALKGESGNLTPILEWLNNLKTTFESTVSADVAHSRYNFVKKGENPPRLTKLELRRLANACRSVDDIILVAKYEDVLLNVTVKTTRGKEMPEVNWGDKPAGERSSVETDPVQFLPPLDI